MRLITVVMGEDNPDNRTKDTIAMMDYGFNMYSLKILVKKHDILGKIKVNLGKTESINMISTKNITILNNSQSTPKNVTYDIVQNKITAPIKVGDIVGKINIYENNNYQYSVDITVEKDVSKANVFTIFIRNLLDIISGNIIKN